MEKDFGYIEGWGGITGDGGSVLIGGGQAIDGWDTVIEGARD